MTSVISKKKYMENYNSLIEQLKLYEIEKNSKTYAIGELKFVFDRDNEGFYEENSITVYDYFSKISITLYYYDANHSGVVLSPFMKINGCGSLIPDIIGKIDIENTFFKLNEYIKYNKKIYFSYNEDKQEYIGLKKAVANYKISLDLFNLNKINRLKEILNCEFSGLIEAEYNGNSVSLDPGTNVFDYFSVSKEVFYKNEENYIFYPTLIVQFEGYEVLKDKIKLINEIK